MILLALLLAVVVFFLLERLGAPAWVAFLVALVFLIAAIAEAPVDFDLDGGRGR